MRKLMFLVCFVIVNSASSATFTTELQLAGFERIRWVKDSTFSGWRYNNCLFEITYESYQPISDYRTIITVYKINTYSNGKVVINWSPCSWFVVRYNAPEEFHLKFIKEAKKKVELCECSEFETSENGETWIGGIDTLKMIPVDSRKKVTFTVSGNIPTAQIYWDIGNYHQPPMTFNLPFQQSFPVYPGDSFTFCAYSVSDSGFINITVTKDSLEIKSTTAGYDLNLRIEGILP